MSSKQQTTSRKNGGQPALVSKLRFPVFQDAERWERIRLVDICTKITQGGTPDTSKSEYWGGSINWMTPAEMGKTESPFIHSTNRTITESGLKNCSSDLLPKNSVILSVRAPIGHLAINTAPMAINQGCKGLIPGNALDFVFLFYSLVDSKSRLIDLGAGNTFKELSGSALKNFGIGFPKEPEQRKIAECLSSVDELIVAQARKVDALQTHKKGLMKQLFPREGETQPRLRFPEFQNAGNWMDQRLDELAYYENGKAHENDISENGRYIVVNSKFISTEGDIRKFSNEGFCIADTGNLLMVLSDVPNGRAIAKCYFVESDDLYTVNQRICKLQPTKVNGRLLFYILDRNSYFLDFDDGIKQTNLRKEDVLSCPLRVPPLPDEQQRIADCLTSLDNLITAQIQKLETLKTHKKGLMQQLFPSPDEVEA
jgi:type I restriction enzyme, S subunit